MVRHPRLRWRPEEGTIVLYLEGDVDAATSADVHVALTNAHLDKPLVVDLSAVTFIDAVGVQLLIWIAKDGGELRSLAPPVKRRLEVLGDLDVMPPWF